ncbi:hypothetical protein D3C87_1647330 [compost metagenome]
MSSKAPEPPIFSNPPEADALMATPGKAGDSASDSTTFAGRGTCASDQTSVTGPPTPDESTARARYLPGSNATTAEVERPAASVRGKAASQLADVLRE